MGKELGVDKHQIDVVVEDIFWKFFGCCCCILVVYNRQVTCTDLGMDKHQIFIVEIFCKPFEWDGQSSEQVILLNQQLTSKDQKWTDFWIHFFKILPKLCSFCRFHTPYSKSTEKLFVCSYFWNIWLSTEDTYFGLAKLAMMERNFIQVLFWLFF